MNKTAKKYLIMLLGSLAIGIGVAFIVYGDIGGDPLTTLEQGLARTFNTTVPITQIFANVVFVAILFLLDRKRVSLDTMLSPLAISFSCSLAMKLLPTVNVMVLRLIYLIMGITIAGLGIGIGAQSESGSNPYDGVVLSLSERFNIKYSLLRTVFDLLVLIIGILLSGSWGIGTIISLACQGYIAGFFIKTLKKIIK